MRMARPGWHDAPERRSRWRRLIGRTPLVVEALPKPWHSHFRLDLSDIHPLGCVEISIFMTHVSATTEKQNTSRSHNSLSLPISIVVFLIGIAQGIDVFPAIGLAIFAYSVIWYLNSTGYEVSVAPIVSLISSAQWLVGPYFAYYHGAITIKYRMYVSEEEYFNFVVPALFAMILFLRVFTPTIPIENLRNYLIRASNFGHRNAYYLFMIGLIANFSIPYVIDSLRFAMFIVSQLTFISVIYMMVLRLNYRWLFLVISIGLAFLEAVESSLFHVILLWSAFIASYVCYELRIRFWQKALGFCVAIFLVVQLQAAKSEYRLRIYEDPSRAGISTLVEVMFENSLFENSKFQSTAGDIGHLNARLNQGWIISAIMHYVPYARDFEEGDTILAAIEESILPRFLFDKERINVSENFEKYTGLSVSRHTSFGISVLGESWINFGYYGIVFMALFGAFYGICASSLVSMSRAYPTVILWMPLVFLQAVKAETELVVVLNHLVKSGVFVVFIYVFSYKVLKWKI